MPKSSSSSSRIRTLRDLQDDSYSNGQYKATRATEKSIETCIRHIPNLPQSDQALQLLRRIHKEFYPIIVRRGYAVLSISEMCCCGDGLDYSNHNSNSNATTNGKRKRQQRSRKRQQRKHNVMPSNVLGYNQTEHSYGTAGHNQKTHEIHLRLRNPRNHAELYDYQDIAGTMSHELAHCVHGPHSTAFYKLMDQIQEQHATFLLKGIVADRDGFPMNSREAYVLGKDDGITTKATTKTAKPDRNKIASAAETRQQKLKWMPWGPQRLGGGGGNSGTLGGPLLPPGVAAARAAEQRRLVDEQWCQPCQPCQQQQHNQQQQQRQQSWIASKAGDDDDDDGGDSGGGGGGVIDLVSESGEDDGSDDDGDDDDKVKKLPATAVSETKTVIIDLDSSDDDDDNGDNEQEDKVEKSTKSPPIRATDQKKAVKRTKKANDDDNDDDASEWTCQACTLRNAGVSLACSVCANPKETDNSKILAQIGVEDAIERVKETEVERSHRDFGFNIYGATGRSFT